MEADYSKKPNNNIEDVDTEYIRGTRGWSNAQMVTLINAYKEEPCLYAKDSSLYHHMKARESAFLTIYEKMKVVKPDVTFEECKNRLIQLRKRFITELAQVRKNKAYKPRLWYYNQLTFISKFVHPRKKRKAVINTLPLTEISQEILHDPLESSNESNDMIDTTNSLDEQIEEKFMVASSSTKEKDAVDDKLINLFILRLTNSVNMYKSDEEVLRRYIRFMTENDNNFFNKL